MTKRFARGAGAESPNPLVRWFDSNRITQQAFADRCSIIDGRRVSQAQVSHWLGRRVPILATRRLIERATYGGVPASAWPDRKRNDRPPSLISKTHGSPTPLHRKRVAS
jgi:hypothetical protein